MGIAIGLIAGLSACAGRSGGDALAPGADYYAVDSAMPTQNATQGPMADYPQVLGEPYVVDGQTFTPADVLSYDAVGYATLDMIDERGVTASHKTLPLPSYVELTSLDTGKTILARVERRGPMTSSRIVGLSQGAARELDAGEGTPIRIRRVNAPEFERARLRAGEPAGNRLDTPDTLLAVLRKQLPETGAASLARTGPRTSAALPEDGSGEFDDAFAQIEPGPSSVADSFDDYSASSPPQTAPSYALPPIGELPTGAAARPGPVEVACLPQTRAPQAPLPEPQRTAPVSRPAPPAPVRTVRPAPRNGRYLIQVASFSSKDNAIDAADNLAGFVVRSGAYFRVRMGPYATRGEADGALAKARRAGYRDAFIDTSD
ncbi:SPOR domain-containing protein [Alteriqipengyuania lutimaris]|uniref:SPOR domain-containing protein n=1 Tax=Alteriqipengyuania lutimaris TaxID=1538146 RepID=UPI0017C82526|nr:SPOR domain-containing protein [Alteriqipengyuania lutimaris]MBB3032867.1 rare lipoprotein A [Alteriqipengyuania lutimaris]